MIQRKALLVRAHLSLQCHRDDNPKPENQGVKALELNNNPFHNLEPPEFISWIEN